MKYRLLSILALLGCLFAIVTAQTDTITFDTDTDTLSYTLVSRGMSATIGCDTANPCLIGTAARGMNGQRVGLVINFNQRVRITSVSFDYSLMVNGITSPSYHGGVWDLQITDNGRFVLSSTVAKRLPFDGTWTTLEAGTAYLPASPALVGDSLRIQVRPHYSRHTGATIRIDNVVIEYTP